RVARGKESGELAAVEPDPVALRTGVDDHRFIDSAVNTQQSRVVPRALRPLAGSLFVAPTPQQSRNVARVLREQLSQFVCVEPDAVARRAAVDRHAVYCEIADIFSLTFGTFHWTSRLRI